MSVCENENTDLSVNGTPVDIGGQIFAHRSVMLEPCMQALAIRPDGIYVDGTAGGGGHSYEIARRLTTGRLIAIDQDEAAIKAASAKLSPLGDRATVVRNNFCHVADVLDTLGIDKIDGKLVAEIASIVEKEEEYEDIILRYGWCKEELKKGVAELEEVMKLEMVKNDPIKKGMFELAGSSILFCFCNS